MDALQHAMQPAITDIEVSWHLPEGYDVIQTPKRVPVVFDKERLVLYGILSRPAGSEDKGSPRTPVKRKIDWSMRSFSNSSVKVFWFEDEFEFLPEEQQLMEADETEEVSENEFKRDGRYVFPRTRLEALSDQEDDNLHHDACAGVSADHLGDDGSRAQDSMVEAETKDRVTSGCLKFQQRDSGVEFGMEESDKSPDGRDEEENEFEPKEAEMPRETPLTDSTGAALESAHEPFVRVYKDSGYLEQIGVPADFGAVRIKGYSGEMKVGKMSLHCYICTPLEVTPVPLPSPSSLLPLLSPPPTSPVFRFPPLSRVVFYGSTSPLEGRVRVKHLPLSNGSGGQYSLLWLLSVCVLRFPNRLGWSRTGHSVSRESQWGLIQKTHNPPAGGALAHPGTSAITWPDQSGASPNRQQGIQGALQAHGAGNVGPILLRGRVSERLEIPPHWGASQDRVSFTFKHAWHDIRVFEFWSMT